MGLDGTARRATVRVPRHGSVLVSHSHGADLQKMGDNLACQWETCYNLSQGDEPTYHEAESEVLRGKLQQVVLC